MEGALPGPGALRGANVLLVTIDTLRADRLGSYGAPHATPALDAVAASGLRFTRAYTHAVMTLPAHASLLTGLVPPRHGVRNNGAFHLDESIHTVPERLRAAGYRTGAFVGAFVLDRRFGLAQGFDTYDDHLGEHASLDFRIAERPAEQVLDAAARWLGEADTRPWFAWVHLFDPHTPYRAPVRTGVPYDDEVIHTDVQIGRFLDQQRRAGRLDSTLVIVTADHGESLGDHGEATHGLFAYEATLRVPLLLAGPNITPGVVDVPVSHVNVAATLLSLVGAAAGGLDGDSIQSVLSATAETRRAIYFEAMDANLTRGWAPLAGVLRDRWKYIDLPMPELYDVAGDPAESVNLVERDASHTSSLIRDLEQWRRTSVESAQRAPLDREASERLQSLGYLAGGARPRRAAYTGDDDPKTLLPLHRRFMDALEQAERSDTRGAIGELRGVIAARPDFAAAYLSAASLLIATGRAPEAVTLLEDARTRGLASPQLDERHAAALLASGQPARAAGVLERVVTAAPHNVEAWNMLGVAWIEARRWDDARRALTRALAAAPSSAGIWTNLGLLEIRIGRRAEAAAAFRRATDLDPRAVDAWRGLGAAALDAGDRQAAVSAWKRAVELEPTDAATLFNLSVLLAEVSPGEAGPYVDRFLVLPGTSRDDRAHIQKLRAHVAAHSQK